MKHSNILDTIQAGENITKIETKQKQQNTYQRVETYSVYGGKELTSRTRPKSAILISAFVTNKFSAREHKWKSQNKKKMNEKYEHNSK